MVHQNTVTKLTPDLKDPSSLEYDPLGEIRKETWLDATPTY